MMRLVVLGVSVSLLLLLLAACSPGRADVKHWVLWDFARSPNTGICYEVFWSPNSYGWVGTMAQVDTRWCDSAAPRP